MPLYEYNGKRPVVGKRSYIFDNAVVIGDVVLGENTYAGPGAVIRGDYGRIEVGTSSTIEDLCVMHARPGQVCRIDDHVTLGHAAIVHTAHVKDWCVIGMGAIGQAVARNLNIDCGCFGTVAGRKVGLVAMAEDLAMLAVTLLLSAVTLGTGRTHMMQGAVHLVVFAAFLFLAFLP